jgi:hypothetical protein
MAKAKKGDILSCTKCGLVVVVDKACGCAATAILCCGKPMAQGKPAVAKAVKKAAPAKATIAAKKAPVKAVAAKPKAAAPVKAAPKKAPAKK